jgi:uncharacterized protein YjbJ (UPF0337 family)
MNWDKIEGDWDTLKGHVKEKWAKLTDDDVKLIAGKKDKLVGALKERYGHAKDAAEKEIDSFIAGLRKHDDTNPPKH